MTRAKLRKPNDMSKKTKLTHTTSLPQSLAASDLFAVGDLVKTSPDSEYLYEVAELKRYPHGPMVGIYDEPPSKHVDFWNPSSLTLHEKAPHGHKRTCAYLDDARADCDCMTFAEHGRYLAWLVSANK